MSVFETYAALKKDKFPALLVIFGEEESLVQELKDQFLNDVHFDPTDLSQSFFDLNQADAVLAIEELETLPFFSDSKLVIFENCYNLTTDKKIVFDEKQMNRLESFIDAPNPFIQLVMILHGKMDSRLKIVKKLKKKATLLEATKLKRFELINVMSQLFPDLSTPVLNLIVEKSNEQFSMIKQNIALLKTYSAQRTVTVEDVEKVVPKSLQDNIFLLTELVIRGKIEEVRNLVHDLTLQGEDVIKLTAILTNAYRLYYQTKIMQKKGWSESKQTQILKINPYRVKLANQLVKHSPASYFSNALLELIALDYQIKQSVADKFYLFDVTLIKLTLKKH